VQGIRYRRRTCTVCGQSCKTAEQIIETFPEGFYRRPGQTPLAELQEQRKIKKQEKMKLTRARQKQRLTLAKQKETIRPIKVSNESPEWLKRIAKKLEA
jgi:hypothetical protein